MVLLGQFAASIFNVDSHGEISEDLADPETGSSSSTEVTGGEEISTLNISDPDIDTEDALEWDVLQDVIDRSKKVPRFVQFTIFLFLFSLNFHRLWRDGFPIDLGIFSENDS